MGLYNVIGIVAAVDGGRLKQNAGGFLLWSAAKFFGFPFSEGAFCANFEAHSARPLATRLPLYDEGGTLLP
jgi:hypothetical protein